MKQSKKLLSLLKEADKNILLAREILNENQLYHLAGELSALSIVLSEMIRLTITGEINNLNSK